MVIGTKHLELTRSLARARRIGIDGVIFAEPNAMSSRRVLVWPASLGALLLTAWVLDGCFNGEDELVRIVVLGGGVHQGVVLTGRSAQRMAPDGVAFARRGGVPSAVLHQWPTTADSLEEMSVLAGMLAANPGTQAIVVSDSLHMPRLRNVRDRLTLNGRVYLRQSRLGGRSDPAYLVKAVVFWFREPVAYGFYRLRY